jgi:hypothetical protein
LRQKKDGVQYCRIPAGQAASTVDWMRSGHKKRITLADEPRCVYELAVVLRAENHLIGTATIVCVHNITPTVVVVYPG